METAGCGGCLLSCRIWRRPGEVMSAAELSDMETAGRLCRRRYAGADSSSDGGRDKEFSFEDDIFCRTCCVIQNFSYLCTRFRPRTTDAWAPFFEKSEKVKNLSTKYLVDKFFMPTFAIQNGK